MKKAHYIFFALLLITTGIANAQVVINEVCSANGTIISDQEGNYEDWIELYNTGTDPVNLANYYFETFDTKQRRWIFRDAIIIQPDGCLLIFCSKKDKTELTEHFEVIPWGAWRYSEGTSEPPGTWADANFDDSGWALGLSPIGYNEDTIETTLLNSPLSSFYMRDTFELINTGKINAALMLIDYNDAFVSYVNGEEIARSFNIGTPGIRPLYDALASDEHDARIGTPACPDPFDCVEGYFVEKDVIKSAVTNGTNAFGVQIHNSPLTLNDMSGWPILLLGVKDTTTVCPDCFPIPWEDYLHTNFNLQSAGQRLTLYDPDDNMVDEVILGEMQYNNSRGRYPDGSDNWCLFQNPSPCDANDSICGEGHSGTLLFSLESGFYNSSQTVSITASNSGDSIYYTTNGDWPTQASTPYTGSITIDSTTVLRARQFSTAANVLPGQVATGTYFINDKPSLPVISLCTDSLLLFDTISGLYMKGINCNPWDEFPYWGCANYYQDIELPAHVEYFDLAGKKGLGQDCGLKIHGNFSRGWPQKSFRFLANDKYGDGWFNFQPFPNKDVTKFKSFNVRNGGVGYNTVHFRDGLMNRAVRSTHVDFMDHQPCVVYVNGKYWGVYGIRERQDEHYVAQNHKLDEDFIDVLRFTGDVQHGKIGESDVAFFEMADFITDNDMSDPANYEIAKSYWDIQNYCDYFIAETYYMNGDWIGQDGANNIRFWRSKISGTWRYILWDTDLGLNLIGSNPFYPSNVSYNFLAEILSPGYTTPHSNMLRSLLDNREFKNYFINRYADLINTTLKPEVLGGVAQEIYDEMKPEMDRHFAKWGAPPVLIWGMFPLGRSSNVTEWTAEFDSMMAFINDRPKYVRDSLEGYFSLNKQVDVTLDVEPAGAGKIRISTIAPEQYPWSGVYFDGVPVTITALPNSGYEFSHWTSDNLITSPDSTISKTLDITSDDAFKAHFNVLDYDLRAFPNPFNDRITIQYNIPKDGQVALRLYSVLGTIIAKLETYETWKNSGTHQYVLDPDTYSLPAGIYLVELKTRDFTKIIKIARNKSN